MGYIHETYVGEGQGGEDGCSVATTFQFQDPQPVHQWKNFLTRWGLSHYARDEPCLKRMEPYVFLGPSIKAAKTEEEVRERCGKAFSSLDQNKDGLLTKEEIEAVYEKHFETHFFVPWTEPSAQSQQVLKQAKKEKVQWTAEDALLYHDDNGDGKVSLEEFETSVMKFLAVKGRTQTIKKAKRDRKKLYKAEQSWIRQHLCASDDCPALEQLEKDYNAKGKKRRRKSQAEL